jgi:hypothetical protein
MTRIAYYEAEISAFLITDENALLGTLTKQHGFALEHQQKHAWVSQIQILKQYLPTNLNGWIYFEFSIPRMGKRVDVVIVTGGVVFVIEFKVGAHTFDKHAIEQVQDYALDLKNFHLGSHALPIVPILIPTGATSQVAGMALWGSDKVAEPICISPEVMGPTIDRLVMQCSALPIDALT